MQGNLSINLSVDVFKDWCSALGGQFIPLSCCIFIVFVRFWTLGVRVCMLYGRVIRVRIRASDRCTVQCLDSPDSPRMYLVKEFCYSIGGF